MTARHVLLALALVLGGCSASLDGNPTPRCDDAGSCMGHLVCDRGFCVTADGAVSPLDAGNPGSDAGFPPCGGPDTVMRCFGLCVDTDSSSLDCGRCGLVCGAMMRCNNGSCEMH